MTFSRPDPKEQERDEEQSEEKPVTLPPPPLVPVGPPSDTADGEDRHEHSRPAERPQSD